MSHNFDTYLLFLSVFQKSIKQYSEISYQHKHSLYGISGRVGLIKYLENDSPCVSAYIEVNANKIDKKYFEDFFVSFPIWIIPSLFSTTSVLECILNDNQKLIPLDFKWKTSTYSRISQLVAAKNTKGKRQPYQLPVTGIFLVAFSQTHLPTSQIKRMAYPL